MSGDSRKLSIHWYGPYTVSKVGCNGKVYYLNDPLGDPLKYPVSYALLKPFNIRLGEATVFKAFPDNIESASESVKDHNSSPNALLQWNDPADTYVPPFQIPSNMDSEERAVLEELKSPSSILIQRPIKPKRVTKQVVRPQSTFVSDKRKVRRKYY